jgi:hypothetical protein
LKFTLGYNDVWAGQQHTVFDAQEHSCIYGRSDFHVFWRHDGWLFPKFPIEPNARLHGVGLVCEIEVLHWKFLKIENCVAVIM